VHRKRTHFYQAVVSAREEILHNSRKCVQRFVQIVHLDQNAKAGDDGEHIGRGMSKLVISTQSELEGNAKRLDRHHGYGSNGGTYRNEN
jgi:hypothetical protein